MSASLASFAAEPITPRGMVAFAYGSFTRVWVAQLLVAMLAAVSVLWLFDDSCAPVIKKGIDSLTGTGQIADGKLTWHGDSPKVLAEERVLGLDLDLDHTDQIHCISDIQVEFGGTTIRAFCLLPGYQDFPYPDNVMGQPIPVSREFLDPLWGAWLPDLEALLLGAVFVVLLLTWNMVATIYWLPVWLLSFLARRDLGFLASWRLAAAALLPGGLLLALAFFLYDFGYLNLVQFSFVVCAHIPLAWLYIFVSLIFLPGRGARSKSAPKNPFMAEAKP